MLQNKKRIALAMCFQGTHKGTCQTPPAPKPPDTQNQITLHFQISIQFHFLVWKRYVHLPSKPFHINVLLDFFNNTELVLIWVSETAYYFAYMHTVMNAPLQFCTRYGELRCEFLALNYLKRKS